MRTMSMLRVLLTVALVIQITLLEAAGQSADTHSGLKGTVSSGQNTMFDFRGTWSGVFRSNSSLPPFTMTVVIDQDAQGKLIAKASHNSSCLKDLRLQAFADGRQLVLAGTDDAGDTVTLRGKIDNTGTLLTWKYVSNGSMSGRCESDTGSGTMGKPLD
jgi:hypothetical protein